MTMTELFLDGLDREVERSRHALEQVPDDTRDWKPHDTSMPFGYLSDMVATIPTWFAMIVTQDELDIAPKDGPKYRPAENRTSAEYIAALDKAAAAAREALRSTTDDHLLTHWHLLVGGRIVSDTTRYEMIQDTMAHWAHHRGQMTVYLRLMGAKVPALYGPSADDPRFG
jgi:uncharacterized damage-inducible protein DinB